MAKTIRMSKIIRKARDKYLWSGDDNISQHGNIFSCHAIEDAILNMSVYYADGIVSDILKKYGCDIYSGKLFDKFETWELKQGARFLWLSFLIEATKNVKIKL